MGGQLMAGWLLGRRMTHAVAPTVAPPPRLPHLLVRQAAGCGLQAAHAPCLWVVGVWCGSLAGTDPVCNRIACGAGELRAAVAAAAGACQQGSTDLLPHDVRLGPSSSVRVTRTRKHPCETPRWRQREIVWQNRKGGIQMTHADLRRIPHRDARLQSCFDARANRAAMGLVRPVHRQEMDLHSHGLIH